MSTDQTVPQPPGDDWPLAAAAWPAALVLMLVNTLAFVDRQALALLVEPIKRDLQISDTAISLLHGGAFSLFYVAVGVPVAWLADRSNRRNLIAASIALWSSATIACGMARSFPALLGARLFVGAGEGGLSPSALSILADYFPQRLLPTAIGIYQAGIYLGGAAALLVGGLLSTWIPPLATVELPLVGACRGWQLLFVLLGLMGLPLLALLLAVPEPRRRGVSAGETSASLRQFLDHVGRRRSAYLGLMLAYALMILVGSGTQAWIPAFLERRFGWTTAEIGGSYGLIVLVCGCAGALGGGGFASWLRGRGHAHANLIAAMLGFSLLVPLTIGFPLLPSAGAALAAIGAMNFFAGFNFGGGLAALNELTPNRMRAQLAAGYAVAVNLIGGVCGPTAIALMLDHGFRDSSRLPEAMALTATIVSPLAVAALWWGFAGYRRALEGL